MNFLALLIAWIFPPESLPAGVVTKAVAKQHCSQLLWEDFNGRMELLESDSGVPNDRILKVTYPRGAWGSQRSGAQAMFKLPARESMTLRYQVRFGESFDFVKGGKLPGLAGGEATSGNIRPTGDGWTARFMWRKRGEAVLYLYHLDQRDDYGDDFALNCRFEPGKWHEIKQTVTVNRPGQSDGQVQVWFDGEAVLHLDDLRLRKRDLAPVDRFYFSTFHGGSGKSWAPSRDCEAEFRGIQIDTD